MTAEQEKTLLTDTKPPSVGFRRELSNPSYGRDLRRVSRLKIAGIVVVVVVALGVFGRRSYLEYQHRLQVRKQFASEHAKDCAESWNGVETSLRHYEEAHKHLLDQLAAEDTEAVINRDVPDYLTRAAALHDSLIHARAVCPAQADPSRETNTGLVVAIDGVDVRDLR